MLQDETTRYQLVLQVRQDVYTGKLPCSWVTQALLGSFLVQSELGDYDPDSMGPGINYLRQFEFVRNPTDQLLQKIMELHKTHKYVLIELLINLTLIFIIVFISKLFRLWCLIRIKNIINFIISVLIC